MGEHNPALLPSGLTDLLPPEAAIEADAVAALMNRFESFGYQRVKPPLVEFEDSLLAPGPGQALAHQTFRLMDPVSQRMMGVRSDTTPQIARIAASRLSGEDRPLRLAYATEVLRVKSSQLRTERQFTQVGCELIGSGDIQADVEAAVLGLMALSGLGLSGLSIDLSMPPLVAALVGQTPDSELIEALGRRDRSALDALKGEEAAVLVKLLDCTGPAETVLEALKALDLSGRLSGLVEALCLATESIIEALSAMGLDVAVTTDPVELKGFEYKSGASFTFFAEGVRGELGRGGRYDVVFAAGTEHEKIETAAGFTLYMDTIRRALPAREEKTVKKVMASEGWTKVRTALEDGCTVIREFEEK